MDFIVQSLSGTVLHLNINEKSSIQDLHQTIYEHTNIESNHQRLIKNGKIVETIDKDFLAKPGTIWLVPKIRAGTSIHVKHVGVILTVEVDLDEDCVYNLKVKIGEKRGVETSNQILIFKGRTLDDDDMKLSAAGIQKGDMLQMEVKVEDTSVKVEPEGAKCCCFI